MSLNRNTNWNSLSGVSQQASHDLPLPAETTSSSGQDQYCLITRQWPANGMIAYGYGTETRKSLPPLEPPIILQLVPSRTNTDTR